MAIFADEKGTCARRSASWRPTLANADRALAALNDAFPSTRAFAREILPGVRETPATIEASFPWIAQTRRLVGPSELGGLARTCRRPRATSRAATDGAWSLLPETRLAASA